MQNIVVKKNIIIIAAAIAAMSIVGCVELESEDAPKPIHVQRTVVSALEEGQPIDVIVEFASAPDLTALQRTERATLSLQQAQLPIARTFQVIPAATSRLSSADDLARLMATPGVVAVHADERLEKHAISAADFIHQPEAMSRGYDGAGTAVAVLDTGVDLTRAAFGNCATAGGQGCKVVFAQDFAPEDNTPDVDGHGTNVAGAVLAVAPGADIIALDVFDGDTARSSDVIAAIDWVVQNRQTYNISAINLSMGSGKFTSVCSNNVFAAAISTARQQGVLTISSSGNDGYTDGIGQPACAPDVISVGAVYDRDMGPRVFSTCADTSTGPDQVACFSNTSDFISIMAPGVSIQAAGIAMSGTSQAAPLVAGSVAVLRAAYPSETTEQIANRLLNRAPNIIESRVNRQLQRVDLEASLDPLSVECQVNVTNEQIVASPNGGSFAVNIQTGQTCEWAFGESVGWITLENHSGTGPGTMTVIVAPNDGAKRGALVSTASGITVPVVQDEDSGAQPKGRIALDFGNKITKSSWLTLETTITSNHEVTEMCVGVGSRCQEWKPFSPITLVEVPDHDGWKFVRVWVRDAQGNISDAFEDHIILDRTPPIDGTVRIDARSGEVDLRWTMAMEFGSGIMFYRVVSREGSMPRDCELNEQNNLVYQGLAKHFEDVRADSSLHYYRVCAVDYAFNMSPGKTAAGGPR